MLKGTGLNKFSAKEIKTERKMNTTENNKIIAEFMGVASNGIVFQDENTKEFHPIKYHFDWNWLMEVVEKIEEMDFVFNVQYTLVETHDLRDTKFKHTFKPQDKKTKKESIYIACVEFIKWYNEQKSA